ncbi:MAG: bifunctional diaminohydroxyphosphoribosylaminopyrimidine deaminase/5-amino-6-(5-phosphoribosylamino)uracil reductase RibD [Candidatus Marinimicrobia bacterium]|nr:bifunctional diaminohydroxyphosphoribosylaminopyrimidine deaminase/5-amino-6-(5-phosphoribosylamino)uracil reductase RibD [Candidatus Neomarinimicrobiota bacterium]
MNIEKVAAVERGSPDGRHALDPKMMSHALNHARRGLGKVSPNPLVGAVIVKDGHVIGEGYHAEYGGPHAETIALEHAGPEAMGATIYINLEPCTTTGNTPPCTRALIRAGIARAVVAVLDPNPQVNGKGIRELRKAGIDVSVGLLAEEAAHLNRGFFKWVQTGLPYITLKVARTSDNFTAVSLTDNRRFTSPQSLELVHQMRAETDAVMIGRRTAQLDDPQLTTRLVSGPDPLRIILDSDLRLPDNLAIFKDGQAKTLRFTAVAPSISTDWGEQLTAPRNEDGLQLDAILKELGDRGITSVLVEGGPALHANMLAQNLADEIVIFTAAVAADTAAKENQLLNRLEIPESWHRITEASSGTDRVEVAAKKNILQEIMI